MRTVLTIAALLFVCAQGHAEPAAGSGGRFQIAQGTPVDPDNNGGVQNHPDNIGSSGVYPSAPSAIPSTMPPPMPRPDYDASRRARESYERAARDRSKSERQMAPAATTAPK